ncbi:MAG: hypothetical protein GC158_09415 [Cyanobacteria bacterium RI_101]|nr:hypothetical protein [Cyanobacteria bacterium RI_101]
MYQLFGLPLLPLIGGYIFLANFNRTKPRTYHYSGYKLLFYSASVGLIGDFIVSMAQALLGLSTINHRPWFLAILSFLRILDKPNPKEVLVLLLLSTSWILLNQLPWFTSGKALRQAIFDLGTPLEKLLLDAQINEQLVSISLKNDKVYIGFVIEAQLSFRPYSNQEGYITILPIISGYREAETKKFTITTRYYEVIYNDDLLQSSAVKKKDFHSTIPEREVITLSKFDYDVFQTFKISTES